MVYSPADPNPCADATCLAGETCMVTLDADGKTCSDVTMIGLCFVCACAGEQCGPGMI